MMKILRPFTGTGAIFFPIGSPPDGTCEFASRECLKNCYAALPRWPDFDEQLLIPEEEKKAIYSAILTSPIGNLVDTIIDELDGLQTNILHWFASGDCPMKDIGRVLEIIHEVASRDPEIIQMGFTRNRVLWQSRQDVFALTVDTREEARELDGMASVPDFKAGTSEMYYLGLPTRGGRCGPELCRDWTDRTLIHFINCQTCLRLQLGCFDRRGSKSDG